MLFLVFPALYLFIDEQGSTPGLLQGLPEWGGNPTPTHGVPGLPRLTRADPPGRIQLFRQELGNRLEMWNPASVSGLPSCTAVQSVSRLEYFLICVFLLDE